MKWKLASESGGRVPRPARVLLAEDDDVVRKLVALILRKQGNQVVATADGAEAVAAWRDSDEPFDLLIFDLQMPNLGGYAAYRRIREMHPPVRVLFMSGSMSDDWDQVQQAGLPFLAKPFTGDQLIQAVRNLLPPELTS